MGHLADDVFVAALAVRDNAAEVALGAGGHEQGGFKAEHGGDGILERVDARVVAEDIITERGRYHSGAHGRGRAGHGVAAQINQWAHGAVSWGLGSEWGGGG